MGADEEGMLECLKALRRARRALKTDARRQLMEQQFDFLGFTYSPRPGQARLTLRPCWHQGSSAAAVTAAPQELDCDPASGFESCRVAPLSGLAGPTVRIRFPPAESRAKSETHASERYCRRSG